MTYNSGNNTVLAVLVQCFVFQKMHVVFPWLLGEGVTNCTVCKKASAVNSQCCPCACILAHGLPFYKL